MSIDIFISYAREDARKFKQIHQAERLLSEMGYAVWRDDKLPAGEAYPYELARAIEAAKLVIVFWGDASVLSQWVYEEAERAKRAEKLLPVTLTNVTIPMGFGLLQAIDICDWSGDERAPSFQKLKQAVAVRIGAPTDQQKAMQLLVTFKEYVMQDLGFDLESALEISTSDRIEDYLDLEDAASMHSMESSDSSEVRQAAIWALLYDVGQHARIDIPEQIDIPDLGTVGELLAVLGSIGELPRRLGPDESSKLIGELLDVLASGKNN